MDYISALLEELAYLGIKTQGVITQLLRTLTYCRRLIHIGISRIFSTINKMEKWQFSYWKEKYILNECSFGSQIVTVHIINSRRKLARLFDSRLARSAIYSIGNHMFGIYEQHFS